MTIKKVLFCMGLAACGGSSSTNPIPVPSEGPDDGRRPELGDDLSVMLSARTTMGAGLAQAEPDGGAVIEAKFELAEDDALNLSTYPVDDITLDSERSAFTELAGDAVPATWAPASEEFHDQEHLTRSSTDLTLVQLSATTLRDVVAADAGIVFWAIPTVHAGRAGYGVYSLESVDGDGDDGDDDLVYAAQYRFVDGGGANARGMMDLGAGPGAGATDSRTPEMGDDLTVLHTATISMSEALAQVDADAGTPIEAKFELGDDGLLSLSVYPADITKPAEANTLSELAGDPTGASWVPSSETFMVPDEEHLTRSARDLTLVQTAGITLRAAVDQVEAAFPGGVVYWAIPTRRGTQSGYGIYVLDADDVSHYLFVS
jgi:hypothetical protein